MPTISLVNEFKLNSNVTALAWAADSNLLATSENSDMVVKIWQAESGQLLHTINKKYAGSRRLLFAGDSKYLLTSSAEPYDGVNQAALSIIDVATGTVARNIRGPHDPTNFPRANAPHDFSATADGRYLFVAYNTSDATVYVYDTSSWLQVSSFHSIASIIRGGPLMEQVAMLETEGISDTVARVWSISTEQFVEKFKVMSGSDPGAMALNSATCRLATGQGAIISTFDANQGRLVRGDDSETIRIWDIGTSEKVDSVKAAAPVRDLDFSPDGKLLAVADGDKGIMLYNAASLKDPVIVHHFNSYAWGVRFSPDGKFLAATGDDRVLIYKLK